LRGIIQLHRRGDTASVPGRTYVDGSSGVVTEGGLELSIVGVLPGQYKVEANGHFTAEVYFPGPVKLLVEHERIRGGVRGPGGNPDFLFYLTPAHERVRWGLDYGGESGSDFEFEGVPDGEWKVGAWRQRPGEYSDQPPSDTIRYPGTTDWSAAGILSITEASALSGLEIALPEKTNP
jgi:hypothetical protein